MGLLRFIGMCNAAVWLGAVVFCLTALPAALDSREMVGLVGERFADQVSRGFSQIIITRLYYLQIVCAVIASLHLGAERLYSGRTLSRIWLGWLALLAATSVAVSVWVLPQVGVWQRQAHSTLATAEEREAATGKSRFGRGVVSLLNLGLMVGIGVYFWRLSHPENPPRFVSHLKFRS
jgi:hypothetical protein